jgi:hypothetical protein
MQIQPATAVCFPIGAMMMPARKLAVANALRRYCDARNAACTEALEPLLAQTVIFDSQRFEQPVMGRAAVLAYLATGWRYLRSLQDPLDGGSYRVREVSLAEAADVPCGVLFRAGRDEHLCIVEPDEGGLIERIRLVYFPDPAQTRPLWLGMRPAGVDVSRL